MKFILMSFLILNSGLVLADTITCTNADESIEATLNDGTLTLNGETLECLELQANECTSINYDTMEVTKLTLSEDSKKGTLELMPSPGSGEIKSVELSCR